MLNDRERRKGDEKDSSLLTWDILSEYAYANKGKQRDSPSLCSRVTDIAVSSIVVRSIQRLTPVMYFDSPSRNYDRHK